MINQVKSFLTHGPHGIIFIIDGKISFLCLCRRFSLPVRLRLLK